MPDRRSPRSALVLRESLTPERMWARYEALCAERSDVRTTRYILATREAQLEWLHSVGVASDVGIAAFVPEIPPHELRGLVADPDVEAFLWTGFVDVIQILSLFEQFHALEPKPRFDVLDFGCGCGRLLRFFWSASSEWRVRGADANRHLAQWCSSHLAPIPTLCNAVDGPLELSSESADLIYCLSVFTHLREDHAFRWLKELARILRPGGVLVATVHGQVAAETIRSSRTHQSLFSLTGEEAVRLADELPRQGFVHRGYRQDVVALANVGQNYGNSFVTPERLQQTWNTSEFEICSMLPGGLRGWQDIVALRRRT
jgi:SAM-dependent methyltransferase